MQGVFQALGCGISSLVVSLLRLLVIVLPLAWILSLLDNALDVMWLAFPVAEAAACIVAAGLMYRAYKQIIQEMGGHA